MNSIKWLHKILLLGLVCCLFILIHEPAITQPRKIEKPYLKTLQNSQNTDSKIIQETKTAYDLKLHQVLAEQVALQKMKQEIKTKLTPERLAHEFVRGFRRANSKINPDEVDQYVRKHLKRNMQQDVGSIKGKFIVPTTYLRQSVTALAFDSYGYIAGIGTTNIYTLTYEINNLSPGDYYVLTVSKLYAYVDEMYDNVSAPVFSREAWRSATKVTVIAGAATENIDFELQPANELLLTLFSSDSVNVSTVDEATFTLTRFDDPEKLFEDFYEYNYVDGEFTFFIPFLGDFKLGVTPENRPTTWYKGNRNWGDADKISLTNFSDKIDSLDIVLKGQPDSNTQKGEISGIVNGNGEFKMIFAFKANDLSLANIAFIFYSFYSIVDLDPGEYFVYAEDYLGNISKNGSMLGTFYENAGTVAEAKKVTVVEDQSTPGINITLRKGATIKGRITDYNNDPLSDMLIVAMKMNLPNASAFNLFTQMHVGVGQTDTSGYYRIAGLPPGDYILRTLSDYTIGTFFGIPYLDDGPYKGKLVDEFYSKLYNLLDFRVAPKIFVQDTMTVDSIDFKLQKAKFFKGDLYDAISNESINKALMVAYIDSSRYPFYIIPKVDFYGSYELGPFPSGKYRLLATADHDQKDFYLPEFNDNALTFDDAAVLELVDADLMNVDFAFDRAAVIRGHVDLAQGATFSSAGADTLFNFPIVAFNATDGSFSRSAYVQFDGGYRLPRLLPGDYKVLALPIRSPFAATYYGGGDHFDDPESQLIQIQGDQILDLNIELEMGNSTIEGYVISKTTGEPVTNCLVIAYDHSGHAIGMAVTDDDKEGIADVPATGKYEITGLRAGDYYLCTYAFTDESEMAIKVPQYLLAEETDLFGMVFGLLESLFTTDMAIYSDSWYDQVPLRTEFDIPDLVTSFLIYGLANEYDVSRYPFYMPIPYQRAVPNSATPITLNSNETKMDINFQLTVDDLEDIVLDVNQIETNDVVTNDYVLYSNYPNPFNPETVISFNLPQNSQVSLTIYNVLGREIKILLTGNYQRGHYEIIWDAKNNHGNLVPNGIYFYRLQAGSFSQVRKMTLLQ